MANIFAGMNKLVAAKSVMSPDAVLSTGWAKRSAWYQEQSDPERRLTPIEPQRAVDQDTGRLNTELYNSEMNIRIGMINRYAAERPMLTGVPGMLKRFVEAERENTLMLNQGRDSVRAQHGYPTMGPGGVPNYSDALDYDFNENLRKQMDAMRLARGGALRRGDANVQEQFDALEGQLLVQAVDADVRGIARIAPDVKDMFGAKRYDRVVELTREAGEKMRGKGVMLSYAEVESAARGAVMQQTGETADLSSVGRGAVGVGTSGAVVDPGTVNRYGNGASGGRSPEFAESMRRCAEPAMKSYHSSHMPDTSAIEAVNDDQRRGPEY